MLTLLVNYKITEVPLLMLDILNELASYQNIYEYFDMPVDKINLFWSCLNLYQITNDEKIKESIMNIIGINKINLLEFSLEKNILFKELIAFDIHNVTENFEINLTKYIQSFYLFLIILKQRNIPESQYNEILHDMNKNVSRKMLKIPLEMREKFITKDAASKINKEIFEDISAELLSFFKFKENTSVYQNFIDEFFNPIHFAICFEIPKLAKNQKIISKIDIKKFAVMVSNEKFTESNKKLQTIYENRHSILKNIFEWEVIEIEEEVWKNLNKDEKKKHN